LEKREKKGGGGEGAEEERGKKGRSGHPLFDLISAHCMAGLGIRRKEKRDRGGRPKGLCKREERRDGTGHGKRCRFHLIFLRPKRAFGKKKGGEGEKKGRKKAL